MRTSIDPHATQAEKALGKAYLDFSENFTRLEAFHVVADAGIEAGLPAIEVRLRGPLNEIVAAYAGKVPDLERLAETMRSAVRARKHADTALAIHAATVVFAHAILERLLHDLLQILGETLVSTIVPRLAEKKVRLGDLRSEATATLEARAVAAQIRDLFRESLEKKLSFLFSVCDFRADCQDDGYRYDQERLLQLDRDRQNLLHNAVLASGEQDPSLDLPFVQNTGVFFINLVAARLNATVNLRAMLEPYLSGSGSA
jgi:hypothetical protein